MTPLATEENKEPSGNVQNNPFERRSTETAIPRDTGHFGRNTHN